MEVSLVLSCRVGDHTGVLSLVGQHGILYVEEVATLLNASMQGSTKQLKKQYMRLFYFITEITKSYQYQRWI